MKRILILTLVIMCMLCACTGKKANENEIENKNQELKFSEKYLVGDIINDETGNYDGRVGDFWTRLPFEYRICYDGTVEIYMPAVVDYKITENELIGTYKLSDEEINALIDVIDQQKLYDLNPEEDYDILDGSSKTLSLYDKDDNVIKLCGGYMPKNNEFNTMYKAVFDSLHLEEHVQIRQKWVGEQKRGLFDSFLNNRIEAYYNLGKYDESFFYRDISRLGEGEEWCEIRYDEANAYVDVDNDGEVELTLWGPYGGFFIDEEDGSLILLAHGEGTSGVLSYVTHGDEVWLLYSDISHSGREMRHFVKYDGMYASDEFTLYAEYEDSENDCYDETSKFTCNEREITIDEYEQLLAEYGCLNVK